MKKAPILVFMLGLVSLTFIVESCNKDDNPPVTPQLTLYDSLGGTAMVTDPSNTSQKIEQGRLTIRSVVDSTIFVIAADSRINSYFQVLLTEVGNGNLSGFQELSKNLTDFVAVGTGAKNYSYTGMSMQAAHDPSQNPRMNGKAENDDFDAFEEDLVKGAEQNGIMSDNPALKSLARIVESLRGTVVQQ